MSTHAYRDFPRASTGVQGLDDLLGGGFPINRMYLLEGDPGAGKTTLALQFLLAGAAAGEPGVYATLSETEGELRDVAASHGWSLDGVTICELQTAEESLKADSQYTLFHPSEVQLSETTRAVLDTVERVRPMRVSSTPSPRCGCWPATRRVRPSGEAQRRGGHPAGGHRQSQRLHACHAGRALPLVAPA